MARAARASATRGRVGGAVALRDREEPARAVGAPRRIELQACERIGLLERLDEPRATAEPDEVWLDGLDEALAELPAGERDAVELRVIDGLPYDAVAAGLAHVAEGAARVRVARGLGRLRQRLNRDEREAVVMNAARATTGWATRSRRRRARDLARRRRPRRRLVRPPSRLRRARPGSGACAGAQA